jgi:alpha,alpha-trehalase
MTTAIFDGQQWDAPCGWAPLQWWLHEGLRSGGQAAAAADLAARWLASNLVGWLAEGAMFEKYNVTGAPGTRCSGGEYTPQVGFGWSNGVVLDLLVQYDFKAL